MVEGATHCHLYIPIGSECRAPGVDVGSMAALDRAMVSAFLALYLQGDSAAADYAWTGAAAINSLGPWSVAVKSQPLVEFRVGTGREPGMKAAGLDVLSIEGRITFRVSLCIIVQKMGGHAAW